MMDQDKEWFKTWFNTPYYHILYKNRSYTEAEYFIRNLIQFMQPKPGAEILDLACGKGRHSVYLNKLGFSVTGLDLAKQNIKEAKQFENETLSFAVHDMRTVYPLQSFDFIFNLFTSFGYFHNYEDNLKVLNAANRMLLPSGKIVLDFMNVDYAIDNLVKEEVKTVEGIDFHISRSFNGHFIIKNISFTDKGEDFSFQERVQAITKASFEELLKDTNFNVENIFGDFSLSSFNSKKSDRLIFIASKV